MRNLLYAIHAQMLHVSDDAGLAKHQMLPSSWWILSGDFYTCYVAHEPLLSMSSVRTFL